MEVGKSSSRIRDKVWIWSKQKKKVTVFRFVFHFLSPELHSEELEKRKREERKKTAYFDEGSIFTLGSFVKLLLLPTAYVENPEGDDIRQHHSFCPGTALWILSSGSLSLSVPCSTWDTGSRAKPQEVEKWLLWTITTNHLNGSRTSKVM